MFIINFESEVMILVIISFIKLLKPKSRLIITELKNFGYIKNNITYIAISDFFVLFFFIPKAFLHLLSIRGATNTLLWDGSNLKSDIFLSYYLASSPPKTLNITPYKSRFGEDIQWKR